MYYNYHAVAKKLIETDCCIAVSIFESYHHIRPALVLYFNCHTPMPIRNYMWKDYLPLINQKQIPINDKENLLNKFINQQ